MPVNWQLVTKNAIRVYHLLEYREVKGRVNPKID
jgi:hypothetical protein